MGFTAQRQVGETCLNEASSRIHQIFMCKMVPLDIAMEVTGSCRRPSNFELDGDLVNV